MPLNSHSAKGRTRQLGLSIVELMVGIVIGLIVVAAASLVMSGQLRENRRLVQEVQLQQDLRATADIITRELRRAGATTDPLVLQSLWYPGSPGTRYNTYQDGVAPLTGTANEVSFNYSPGPGGQGPFGFKLEDGVIKTRMAGTLQWQELTDRNVMTVTALSVSRTTDTVVQVPCPKACTDGTAACWPNLNVRNFAVSITATGRGAADIERSVRTRVRLRNDQVNYFNSGAFQICPT